MPQKRAKKKVAVAKESTIENLIASALAEYACASKGIAGFGSVDSAKASLFEVLELDPENLEALNLLAQHCAQTKLQDEAWSYFTKAIRAATNMDQVVRLTQALADTYEDQGAYEDAIRVYQEALKRGEDPGLHVGIGYCHGKLSRFTEAVRHHRRAAELAPTDAKVLSDLGFSLIEMGELDEAESTLLRAEALDPEDELARGNLEYCRELMAARGRP